MYYFELRNQSSFLCDRVIELTNEIHQGMGLHRTSLRGKKHTHLI